MKASTTRRELLSASAGILAAGTLAGAALGHTSPDVGTVNPLPKTPPTEPRGEGEYIELAEALSRFVAAREPRARAVRILDAIAEKQDAARRDGRPTDEALQSRRKRINREVRKPLTAACDKIWKEEVFPLLDRHGVGIVLFRGWLLGDECRSPDYDGDQLNHFAFDAGSVLVLGDDGHGRIGLFA